MDVARNTSSDAKAFEESSSEISAIHQCCFLDYGDWSNTHRRFIHCTTRASGEKLLEVVLIDDPDYELLMIDFSH